MFSELEPKYGDEIQIWTMVMVCAPGHPLRCADYVIDYGNFSPSIECCILNYKSELTASIKMWLFRRLYLPEEDFFFLNILRA